jgi:4,5-DOPA dioxygenase extradiol
MDRRKFVKHSIIGASGMVALSSFTKWWDKEDSADTFMPVLFVGHGSPMNAIEDNEFSQTWKKLGVELPKPKAILCISAHWETHGTKITAMAQPRTIHDFGGFPKALHEAQYPAPGAPELAVDTKKLLEKWQAHEDHSWGLDHGTWSVLMPMYPQAIIPVYQLSLDVRKTPQQHVDLARDLVELRKKGVMIIGSGNIVHNLGLMKWQESGFDWAVEFNELIKTKISSNQTSDLISFRNLKNSNLTIPTPEHFLPLLYILGLKQEVEKAYFFNDKATLGSITMTGVWIR